jgi:hypothetical protein
VLQRKVSFSLLIITDLLPGPSAGDEYDDSGGCRHYKKASGAQVADDPRIKGPKAIHFDFIACSGSKLKQIYEDSLNVQKGKPKDAHYKQLKDNPEMVTMSTGGNDVGFMNLLDRVLRSPQCNLDIFTGALTVTVCLSL